MHALFSNFDSFTKNLRMNNIFDQTMKHFANSSWEHFSPDIAGSSQIEQRRECYKGAYQILANNIFNSYININTDIQCGRWGVLINFS